MQKLKTNSPLIIDPNAILACPIALEFFKPVPGRYPKIIQQDGII